MAMETPDDSIGSSELSPELRIIQYQSPRPSPKVGRSERLSQRFTAGICMFGAVLIGSGCLAAIESMARSVLDDGLAWDGYVGMAILAVLSGGFSAILATVSVAYWRGRIRILDERFDPEGDEAR